MFRVFPVLLLFLAAQASAAWRDVYEATVRIERRGAAGSGVVFHIDARHVWCLTNAHVVGRQSTVAVIPFVSGAQRQASLGRVTLRAYTGQLDAAVVRIDRRYWTGGNKTIPLSMRVPRPGEEMITVGCPRADWPSLWHGRITRVDYPTLYFFPGQATALDLMSGRSGSAICDAAGTEVMGLFTWGINRQGGGQAIRFVIEQLWRRRRSVPIPSWEPQDRLPEHLVPVAAEKPKPAGELVPVEWAKYRKPDGTLPRTRAGKPTARGRQQEAPQVPEPAGKPAPREWDKYRKPDGTLPRTYQGKPPDEASWQPNVLPAAGRDCWPRLPWRPGRPPQPQPPTTPGPGGGNGPVLPELPGGSGPVDESLQKKLAQIEARVGTLETTLEQIRGQYEQVRQHWPQIRQMLLSSELPQAEELVQRIERIDQQLRQSVAEAEDAARRAAQQETKGLKERVAELLGRVDALGTAVSLASQYAKARREGESPKEALLGAVDAKLQALEAKLESRVQTVGRGDVATALTYVGIPSVAATIISFFLAGALRRRGDDVLQLVFGLLHSKLDPDSQKKK